MTRNRLDATLVEELIIGEQPEWYLGVCEVEAHVNNRDEVEIAVYGEGGHLVERIECEQYMKRSEWIDGEEHEFYDSDLIASLVNAAVEKEHASL